MVNEIFSNAEQANWEESAYHKCQLKKYSLDDLRHLGEKTGIVQIPPVSIAYITQNKEHVNKIRKIADYSIVAIQICDDLADTIEDFKKGSYSIPVTHGYFLYGKSKFTEKNIMHGLFLSGLFESLLSYANEMLDECTKYISEIQTQPTGILKYFNELKNYIGYISSMGAEIRGNEAEYNNDFTLLSPVESGSVDLSKCKKALSFLEPGLLTPVGINNRPVL